jgi:2,2-dialkylglycine decarboxylase (pyruvate)
LKQLKLLSTGQLLSGFFVHTVPEAPSLLPMDANADFWARHGRHVFAAVPYRDPVLVKGCGAWLTDRNGKRYLDLSSGPFSALFGHGDPGLARAVHHQLVSLVHTNDYMMADTVLAALSDLAGVLPKALSQGLLLSTGAEANECAMRMAKHVTGRVGMVGFDHGYYGLTLATQGLTWGGKHARPAVPGCYSIPVPDLRAVPRARQQNAVEEALSEGRRRLAGAKGTIAMFLVEPILSAGGMLFPPPGYFRGLMDLVREHEALLVCDESQTGLGRTGNWFAFTRAGLQPDILVLSKGAGCGLPVSVVALRRSVSKALEGQYLHFASHQNDPVGACALQYVIRRLKQRNMLQRIRRKGDYFLTRLRELERKDPWITGARGRGLMLAFELVPEIFDARTGYNLGFMLQDVLEDAGVLVQAISRGRIFRLLPPYTITRREIDLFVRRLRESLIYLRETPGVEGILADRFNRSPRSQFYRMFHSDQAPSK